MKAVVLAILTALSAYVSAQSYSTEIYNELNSFAREQKVYNTHSHINVRTDLGDFTLDALFNSSYVDWMWISHEKNSGSRKNYINKLKHNSYYVWLERSLQELYKFEDKISSENWDDISAKLVESRLNHFSDKILNDYCKYETVILDNFKNPGVQVNNSEIFTKAFRVNSFFYGFSTVAKDHNGNNSIVLYNSSKEITNIDDYVKFMHDEIVKQKEDDAVAIKCAIAYDRGLDFNIVPKNRAELALSKKGQEVTSQEIKDFQDYLFFELCNISAELNMPLQIHTGLAKLQKSNAMQLRMAIELNRKTKFVLFHGSYPWIEDIFGLTHNYPNVYTDMCWLPLISTSAAERFFHEIIEVGLIDNVTWGGDSFTAEESYGGLLAMRHVMSKVLSQKVEEGYMDIEEAKELIKKVLYFNAKELYK